MLQNSEEMIQFDAEGISRWQLPTPLSQLEIDFDLNLGPFSSGENQNNHQHQAGHSDPLSARQFGFARPGRYPGFLHLQSSIGLLNAKLASHKPLNERNFHDGMEQNQL